MRTALVTGGTRGIGRAIVELFLANDIRVIATYSRSNQIAEAMQAQYGDQLSFLPFSQGDSASHEQLIAALPDTLDILVNNAGLGSKSVEGYSDDPQEQDKLLLEVNALGPLWLCQALLPKMRDHGYGKVINIASVGGGIFHFPGFRHADGMSKAAIAFMTKQFAAEYTQTGVDIYAVCPGATETDMFNASTLDALSEQEKQALIDTLPKQRLIAPDEIAQLCLFLTTDAAQIMHGAVIDSSNGLGVNPGAIQ